MASPTCVRFFTGVGNEKLRNNWRKFGDEYDDDYDDEITWQNSFRTQRCCQVINSTQFHYILAEVRGQRSDQQLQRLRWTLEIGQWETAKRAFSFFFRRNGSNHLYDTNWLLPLISNNTRNRPHAVRQIMWFAIDGSNSCRLAQSQDALCDFAVSTFIMPTHELTNADPSCAVFYVNMSSCEFASGNVICF